MKCESLMMRLDRRLMMAVDFDLDDRVIEIEGDGNRNFISIRAIDDEHVYLWIPKRRRKRLYGVSGDLGRHSALCLDRLAEFIESIQKTFRRQASTPIVIEAAYYIYLNDVAGMDGVEAVRSKGLGS